MGGYMATKPAEEKVKKMPEPQHIGDGEWSIPVKILHKGLLAPSHYKKDELYSMLGDANVTNEELTKDLNRQREDQKKMEDAHGKDEERNEISRSILQSRNDKLKAGQRWLQVSIVCLALLSGYLLYLVLT